MPAAPVLDGDSNRSGGKRERIYDYYPTGCCVTPELSLLLMLLFSS